MAKRRIKVREKDLEKTRKFNSNNLKEKKQRKNERTNFMVIMVYLLYSNS